MDQYPQAPPTAFQARRRFSLLLKNDMPFAELIVLVNSCRYLVLLFFFENTN